MQEDERGGLDSFYSGEAVHQEVLSTSGARHTDGLKQSPDASRREVGSISCAHQ